MGRRKATHRGPGGKQQKHLSNLLVMADGQLSNANSILFQDRWGARRRNQRFDLLISDAAKQYGFYFLNETIGNNQCFGGEILAGEPGLQVLRTKHD